MGAKKRLDHMKEFQKHLAEVKHSLEKAEDSRKDFDDRASKARDALNARLRMQWESRNDRVNSVVSRTELSWLKSLTTNELSWVVIHSCQLYGEMNTGHKKNSKTCIPLRLAGLDASVVWDQDTHSAELSSDTQFLADTLDENLRESYQDKMIWSRNDLERRQKNHNKKKRRKLLEDLDEEEVGYHVEDDMDDGAHQDQEDSIAPDSSEEEHDAEYKEIASRSFSKDRSAFQLHAKALLSKIEGLKEKVKADEEKNEGEGSESKEETENGEHVDPEVERKIRSLQESLQEGFDCAISAKVLIGELKAACRTANQFSDLLYVLAVGTLAHGKLSLLHFNDILGHVVPELATPIQEGTCRPPWSCPPEKTTRESVQIPPSKMITEIQTLCTELATDVSAQSVCSAASVQDATVPTVINNGYGGYYLPEARSTDDFLHKILEDLALNDDDATRKELNSLSDELKSIEDESMDKESEFEEMKGLVADIQEGKGTYGVDGELYDIRDSCFSIKAGKYFYETCLFGKAKQAENEDAAGTSLGQWSEASINDEGIRTWQWKDGDKCWNGPKRSALVKVTCGEENKVLSAEEPDTCRYVFEMESFLACDEAYRVAHDLPPVS